MDGEGRTAAPLPPGFCPGSAVASEGAMVRLTQAGAIPFRQQGDRVEFLLVTSKSGNWIFPKGIVDPGENPEETAVKECREEAGVRGRLLPRAVGAYVTRKWKRECEVILYMLRYEADIEPWEESELRERCWCTLDEALTLLSRPELARLLESAAERLDLTQLAP